MTLAAYDLAVGGLHVQLAGAPLAVLDPAWLPFTGSVNGVLACRLAVRQAILPPCPRRRPRASGNLWRLWCDEREVWLATYLRGPSYPPDRLLRCDVGWQYGELLSDPRGPDADPLAYPLDQLLWLHLLAHHGGALLHACGLAIDGCGVLLAGHSGAGKSTLARLWLREGGALLLNDDRVVVRAAADGRLRLWSTPWHGDVTTVQATSVPLAAVFILRHGAATHTRRLSPGTAAAELFVRAFCLAWDARASAQTLAFLATVATSVPCYELAFTPDASACAAIRRRL